MLGPDGNVWFSETEVSQIGRITPDGKMTESSKAEFQRAHSRSQSPNAMARCGSSEASGNRIGRMTIDGVGDGISDPRVMTASRSAMATHPDGSIWFVQTSSNSLRRIDRDGNITEHKVTTPASSLRGVCVGPTDDLWFTANAANKIGRMRPDGTMVGEYPIPTPKCRGALHRPNVERTIVRYVVRCRPDRRNHSALTETKISRRILWRLRGLSIRLAASKPMARWCITRKSAASAHFYL